MAIPKTAGSTPRSPSVTHQAAVRARSARGRTPTSFHSLRSRKRDITTSVLVYNSSSVRLKVAMSKAYVALLRGINVGGNNKLPMADLRAMFVEAGCEDVRTYIQSGNVMFSATPDLAATIASV